MTEVEWLACTDPFDLAEHLGPTCSERKFRLFGCACVRGVWKHVPKGALRQATEVCERFADGLATAEELRMAEAAADAAYEGMGDSIADHSAIAIGSLCAPKAHFPMGDGSAGGIAAVAAEAWSNRKVPFHVAMEKARASHCQLFRDIFGNPFRRVSLKRAWRATTVKELAEAIYATQDFSRLPILGDALEDAGCTNTDILDHCRGPGPHVRGCWVVDLVLGKG